MAKQRFRDLKQGKKKIVEQKVKDKEVYAYAKVSTKIKAFLTDSFMLMMPIIYIVFYFIMDGREGFGEQKIIGWIYIFVPLVVIQTLFMLKTAQTPGYRAYNIKIIDVYTGKKPRLFILFFRNTLAILSFFSLIGWALMFFRKDARNLHDLLSGTVIVDI